VFENRILRIFGPKEGSDGRLEKILNFYSAPNIKMIKSRSMRWAGQVVSMGEMRNIYRDLVRKREG
jgi:hypothetical protein